jgi:hypothetical protein
MEKAGKSSRAYGKTVTLPSVDYDELAYKPLENPDSSAMAEVMRAIESGKSVVDDAILYCGRFNQDGLLRESDPKEKKAGLKPYRLFRTRGPEQYKEAMKAAAFEWNRLPEKVAQAARKREVLSKLGRKGGRRTVKEYFQSSSDVGSLNYSDPNQFTEFVPYFNGPFSKQQYFDYFKGHAYAFEQYNHNPIAKRLVDILVQYAFGRGFKVRCKNEKYADKWDAFNRKNKITKKLRKYWFRELLVYGENFIDKIRWISVDPSTIYDIICEGYDEYIDRVLYYQQMFQTATQMYAGIAVKGVPKSKDSKVGHYIVRQIPADQIIHIKTGVMSIEKRGRTVLYPILGWLKRLVDTLNAQVLGEQLRASFVWDDTVDGDQSDVDAHGAKYNYIPVAPTLFVHNKAVERKPLAPMSGITGNGSQNIVAEIIALCATALGLPKDHLNVMAAGSGSRATAVVGSEPFTKVIEDLQEDGNDLIHQIIEAFCDQNGIDYDEMDWQVIFPPVTKDQTADQLKNVQLCEMAASIMEADNYDFIEEMKKDADYKAKHMADSLPGTVKPPPPGRYGTPSKPSPIHGKGKQDILDQHQQL